MMPIHDREIAFILIVNQNSKLIVHAILFLL